MTDIAASDVTYSILTQRRIDGRNHYRVQMAFGDAALTYPAGGIAVDKGKLGCPTIIESLKVVDQVSLDYDFKYDQSAEKLLVVARAHTHDLHLNEADAVDAAGTRVNAATDLLGANSGADVLVSGVDDATGHGGIVKDDLGEASTVAIAAQTIEVEVIGW